MKKFAVEISHYTFKTIVEAKNEEEAIKKAEEEYVKSDALEPDITVYETKRKK